MNFEFGDDQTVLREQAARFLSKAAPLNRLRTALDEADTDNPLWADISGLGWPGIVIPESYGGIGGSYLDLCVIAEELGRVLAPVPFGPSFGALTSLLLSASDEDIKWKLLPRVSDGTAIGALALTDNGDGSDPWATSCEVRSGRFYGRKLAVMDAARATHLVALATREGQPCLCIVDLTDEATQRTVHASIDGARRSASFIMNGAAADCIHIGDSARSAWDAMMDVTAIIVAFEQVGGAERALAMAVDYAKERHAFGQPIGRYQAIKHKLADLYVKVELARSNAYHGAWALQSEPGDIPVAAAAARISAIDAFSSCAEEAVQVHGGMGFTWESDCHLFYRRAKLLALSTGTSLDWKDRLVKRVGHGQAA